MDINRQSLNSAYVGFNAAFKMGIAEAKAMWSRIATMTTSTTRANEYGWLGKMPEFREWVGDRQVNALEKHGYTLVNTSYENTIAVDRDDFMDDNLGIYTPMFQQFGSTAITFPDRLIFNLLKAGFETLCYDKQFFFDSDHPVLDRNGDVVSVSNTGGGAGTPWFLMDVTRPLKPLIYQQRQPFTNLVRMDQENDENVFSRKEYRYGLDGRCSVGFGFWQQAYGSKQPLTAANYAAARAAMMEFKGDYGRPLAVMPNLLVVPPSLESAGRKLLNSEYGAGGETNEWKGTAELLVAPWLA